MTAVWLVSASVLGGTAWWLLKRSAEPAASRAAVRQPSRAMAPSQSEQQAARLQGQNQQLRAQLHQLRRGFEQLNRERGELRQELAQVSQKLAAATQVKPDPPGERERLAQLAARNRELERSVATLRRDLATINAMRADLQAKLNQARQKAAQSPGQASVANQKQLQSLKADNLALASEAAQMRSALKAMTSERAELEKELTGLRSRSAAAPPEPVLVASIPFAAGQTNLGPRARRMLRAAAQHLKRNPRLAVVVQGNADATPLSAKTARLYYDNAGVAMARALSVFRALRNAGVDPMRMTVRAAGAPAKEPEAGRTVGIWLAEPG